MVPHDTHDSPAGTVHRALLAACEAARDLLARGNWPAMERQRVGEILRRTIAKTEGR